MKVFKKMAKTVVAPFEFANNVIRRCMTEFLVHPRDFADIVHIENESVDFIRNFGFCLTRSRGLFREKLTDFGELGKDVGKEFLGH
jgi:hypothetical protein